MQSVFSQAPAWDWGIRGDSTVDSDGSVRIDETQTLLETGVFILSVPLKSLRSNVAGVVDTKYEERENSDIRSSVPGLPAPVLQTQTLH